MDIYTDMVNAKGGVLGRPIKLVIEDNQGYLKKAVQQLKS
jgi:ABC-type branched-subunit amino acid transport system substrate-binding protein